MLSKDNIFFVFICQQKVNVFFNLGVFIFKFFCYNYYQNNEGGKYG